MEKPVLISLFAILILTTIPAAVSGAESVTFSKESISMNANPGETLIANAEVNNTGNETINVSFSGYTLTYKTYTLNISEIGNETNIAPGEARSITIKVDVPANQVAGHYTGTLTASTQSGATDTLSVEVNVSETPAGLSVVTGAGRGQTDPGRTHTASFEVKNERNAQITAQLGGTLTHEGETLTVESASVSFAPYETKTVTATINVPAQQKAGEYTGSIVLSYDNNQSVETNYTLNVTKTYSFTASDASVTALPGDDENATITLTKTGNGNITGINASYVESALYDTKGNRITLSFHPETADITDTAKAVVVEASVPGGMEAGTYTTTITFYSNEGAQATSTFSVEVESILRVRDVNLDSPGTDDKVKPGEELTVEVEVENTDDEIDLEDVVVKLRFRRGSHYLEDDDGDEIEEESDEFDLDADDTETVTFTVTMPYEDFDDGDEYNVEITVEGRNADNRRQVFTAKDESETIRMEKETHEIKFTEADISPSIVRCNRKTAIDIGVQNIGKKDEDVELVVRNEELDVYEHELFTLDRHPDDSDNDWSRTFYIAVPDNADEGTYTFIVEAYYNDGRDVIRKTLDLEVAKCDITAQASEEEKKTETSGGKTEEEEIVIRIPPEQSSVQQPATTIQPKEGEDNTAAYVAILFVLVIILAVVVAYMAAYAYRTVAK